MSLGAPAPAAEAVLAQVERLRDLQWRHGCDDWLHHDLSIPQLRVLLALHQVGATPMSRVAEALGVGPPPIRALIDRLESRGLVTRARGDQDRRVVAVSLTEAGDRLIGDIGGLHRASARALLRRLTPAELEGLRVGLAGISRVLGLASEPGAALPHPV